MPERKMKLGALLVRTRQIVGYAYVQIEASFDEPKLPKVGYKSVAGHTEYKDAPTDSPEWAAYTQQLKEFKEKVNEARTDFLYDYSVESWSFDDGKTWITDAPADWVFPEVFKRHGLKQSDNPRVDYIRYELITSNVDIELLFRDALSNMEPITNAEVSAALGGFRGKAKRGETTGGGVKWIDRLKRALLGNGRRASVGD